MLAAVIAALQWKQSSEHSACRFKLYISDFVSYTGLVLMKHAHYNAIIGGRAHSN